MSNSTNLRVDLQLAGTWTNITDHTYTKEAVTIRRGRTDETSSPQASTLDIGLNNRDGRFTPTNPAGTYYPNLNRQTPIRLGMGTPPAGAGANSQTASTSIVAPGLNAESAGIVFSYWAQHTPTASISPAAGYSGGTQKNGLFSGAQNGFLSVSAGTVAAATATSNQSQPWAAATTFLPGASSATVAGAAAGVYNSAATNPDLLSITFTPVSLNVGDVLLVANAWSGDYANSMVAAPQDNSGGCSWVLVADSGFVGGFAPVPRVLMWAFYSDSVQTVTVTVPNHYYYIDDNLATMWYVTGTTEWNSRFAGQCATFNTTADLSGVDVRTQLEAGSVLRQRGQGQETPRSSLYRYYAKSQASEYWPLEGLTGSALTSPLASVPQAQIVGPAATFDSQSGVPGSDSLAVLAANSYFVGAINPYTAAANQQGAMSCVFQLNTAPTGSPMFLVGYAGGSGTTNAQIFGIQYVNTNDHFNVVAFSPGGATTLFATSAGSGFLPTGVSSYIGRPVFVNMFWAPNQANPTTQSDVGVTVTDMLTGTSVTQILTGNVAIFGQVSSLFFGTYPFPQTFINQPCAVGHITFTPSARIDGSSAFLSDVHQTRAALSGVGGAWDNEDLVIRMTRLAQEQSINFQSRAPSTDTQKITLGQQDLNDTISLLEECQESDGEGELFEARGFPGLTYRSVGEISGAPAQAILNYTGKQVADPFQNVDDDQLTRNDITVQQVNGASQRVYQATGPLNNAPPPTGVGTFTGNPTVNVWNQSRDLPVLAQWALHVGTTNAPRYAAIATKLPASPSTISAVSSLDCGQRFTVTNPPSWSTPGPVEMVALGFNETIGDVPSSSWAITINARPYAPFATLNPASSSTQPAPTATLDSGSSTLTTTVSSTATSISVTTTNPLDLWTTTNVPFDINVTGERMTVTAVTSATSPQTFTVTRSVNSVVKAQTAGAAIDVYYQDVLGVVGT